MRIPARHLRFVVALLAVTILLLVGTLDVPKAYVRCTGDHGFQSPGDTVNVISEIQGADRDDWPLWLSVTWGDGTSYYVDKDQLGTVSFAVQHFYTSPGSYAFSWTTGTAYDTCASGAGIITVP
jgi:hypothetical protein